MKPSRGEIWTADLDPTLGHEQRGDRPVLVVSVDDYNHGPGEMLIVCPLTKRIRHIPSHIVLAPPEGGIRLKSAVLTEQVRSISLVRVKRRLGMIGQGSLERVSEALRYLMGI